MFNEVTLKNIISANTENPLIVLLCPNYEERSIYLSHQLKCLNKNSARTIHYEIFCLRNNKNNDMLLEGLKNENIGKLLEHLDLTSSQQEACRWMQYPDNFSINELKSILADDVLAYARDNQSLDFLIDISTMPKTMIFSLCESIQNIIDIKGKIGKIMFAYVTPKEYSSVHYAQDIGMLNGFFSGRVLRTNKPKAVHSIIFPSRSGHEGKLLVDELSQIPYEQRHTVFFPIDTREYLYSLELMRANQSLLDRESYSHQFYCSTADAIIALDEYLLNEAEELIKMKEKMGDTTLTKQLYLIAPFGSKIFLPISYFALIRLKHNAKISDLVDIEICHVRGFQYTSVYSLGVGFMNIYEMKEEWNCVSKN